MTVVMLVTLTQMLQMELNDITNQTATLRTSCLASTTPGVNAVCGLIPTTSYTVSVDYSAVRVVCVHTCDITDP